MKKPPITGCRRCVYLDVTPDKAGRVIPRSNFSYPCTVPVPDIEDLMLPKSVLDHMRYSVFHKNYMGPDQGAGCKLFKLRT